MGNVKFALQTYLSQVEAILVQFLTRAIVPPTPDQSQWVSSATASQGNHDESGAGHVPVLLQQ